MEKKQSFPDFYSDCFLRQVYTFVFILMQFNELSEVFDFVAGRPSVKLKVKGQKRNENNMQNQNVNGK